MPFAEFLSTQMSTLQVLAMQLFPTQLLTADLWPAVTVVLVSGVMRGFSGFGGAMLVVPVLSIVYSPREAVAISAGLGLIANLQLLPGALRITQWRQEIGRAHV